MAKTLIKCKEDVKKALDAIPGPSSDCFKLKTSYDNQFGAIREGCGELHKRIVVLKGKGMQGSTVEDFAKKDKEALDILKGIKDLLPGLVANNDRYAEAYKKWTAARNALAGVIDLLEKEIPVREKKIFEPKSLPEMKTLLKETEVKFRKVSTDWGVFGPIDNGAMKQKIDNMLKAAVA